MQPRTLDAILAELAPVYDPQVANYRTRQNEIPNQIKAEEEGLAAKQTNAFSEIVNGARRRGLGFSGIPVGEQARYNAQEYMPALARLRQSGREQALSLEDAILGINERRQNQALGMRQYEQQRYDAWLADQEARRRAAADAAAQNAYLNALMRQQTQQQRPSLDSIFGDLTTPPQLRVANTSSASRLQPAARVNVQPSTYNPQVNRNPQMTSGILQGPGAYSGLLRVR